jgi:hypothetical protein
MNENGERERERERERYVVFKIAFDWLEYIRLTSVLFSSLTKNERNVVEKLDFLTIEPNAVIEMISM